MECRLKSLIKSVPELLETAKVCKDVGLPNFYIAGGSITQLIWNNLLEQEPLDKSNPIWSHEKITVLPHISAPTHFESAGGIVATNIKKYRINGQLPVSIDWHKGY